MCPTRFRLTPEEQELAYELKANMMRKLDKQNEKLETEILLNEKLKNIKKSGNTVEKSKRCNSTSFTNAIKLMKMYERKAKEGEYVCLGAYQVLFVCIYVVPIPKEGIVVSIGV